MTTSAVKYDQDMFLLLNTQRVSDDRLLYPNLEIVKSTVDILTVTSQICTKPHGYIFGDSILNFADIYSVNENVGYTIHPDNINTVISSNLPIAAEIIPGFAVIACRIISIDVIAKFNVKPLRLIFID